MYDALNIAAELEIWSFVEIQNGNKHKARILKKLAKKYEKIWFER